MHTAHCMQLKKIKLGKGMFAFHNFQQFFKNKSTEHAFTVQYMLCYTGCIYYCLQTQLRENWFQYVRREYATAITVP